MTDAGIDRLVADVMADRPTHLVAEATDRVTVCGVRFDRGGKWNPAAYPYVLARHADAPGRVERGVVYCAACREALP